ncbi:MAG TPA: undecaprenyl-diphosphatase UppP [Gemmataceae bacterium]|nr:undecaprenyl-diphosphatase UppP [Gemmataceae bacterium]
MTFFQALVIGIIQGLTEFLPVSSNAHIRIVPALLQWDDPGAAFTAVIQWGTLVAVMIYFRHDIIHFTRAVISETLRGEFCASPNSRMAWMIAVGTVPVVVFGLLFKHRIETTLRSLYVISAAMIGLALVLMIAEWLVRWRQRMMYKQKELGNIGWLDAVIIGFAQALALIPGASRSGVTITGGLFQGLTRETAARFSFLLSLPSVFGAGLFELYKESDKLLATQDHLSNLITATVVSGIVGYATIAFLLNYLKKHSTYLFIIYRVVLGSILLILLFTGKIPPGGDDKDREKEQIPQTEVAVLVQKDQSLLLKRSPVPSSRGSAIR